MAMQYHVNASWKQSRFLVANMRLSEHACMQAEIQSGINYMNYVILHQNIFPVLCVSKYI